MTAMTQRLQHSHLPRLPLIVAGIAALCLSGCDQAQPVTYRIPKETREVSSPTMPGATPPQAQASAAGNMNVLPGMQQAADQAGAIGYTVPEGWEELPASGIRKANFKVTADTGSAEITILTFPGDVGGQLANINRWRGQIGLEPTTTKDLPAYSEDFEIAGHDGLYVLLEGETQSILGALLPFNGSTWFIKMLGDTPTVLANEASMKQFLSSIEFEDLPSKETPEVSTPVATPSQPQASAPANMNVLPGMQKAANEAGEVGYTAPDGWQELPVSGIRKANLKVTTETGSAEITILTFPGDVGGRLANINRWRGQVGLEPATPEDLPAYTEGYNIAGHRGLYVCLEGETQSILGALLPFHGSTWFVKMLGDTPTVLANEAAMKQFLDSIKLEDHAH